MTQENESFHTEIVRRRLAIAELECAEGWARITRQRGMIRQGGGRVSRSAQDRLARLLDAQKKLESRRDKLRAHLGTGSGAIGAAASPSRSPSWLSERDAGRPRAADQPA